MQSSLTGPQQSTYQRIFQHPLPRDLRWPDLHALLTVLATVTKGDDGSMQMIRNGRKLFLPRPRRNVATAQEVMDLRRFLQNSEPADATDPHTPTADPSPLPTGKGRKTP